MKFILLLLMTLPCYALSPRAFEELRPMTSRGNLPTLRLMMSMPLRHMRNIQVVTSFLDREEYFYETLVVDRTATNLGLRYLRKQISQTLAKAFQTHEAFEEWCFWVFPVPVPALPVSRPFMDIEED
jgi:hypothetical protein